MGSAYLVEFDSHAEGLWGGAGIETFAEVGVWMGSALRGVPSGDEKNSTCDRYRECACASHCLTEMISFLPLLYLLHSQQRRQYTSPQGPDGGW